MAEVRMSDEEVLIYLKHNPEPVVPTAGWIVEVDSFYEFFAHADDYELRGDVLVSLTPTALHEIYLRRCSRVQEIVETDDGVFVLKNWSPS